MTPQQKKVFLLLFLQKKKSLFSCSFLKKRTKRLLSIAASAFVPDNSPMGIAS